eukprot:m.33182 g.33182  ORF g.33182 m.33182 type:complete len:99 (-) comp14213_c0_seq1:1985-2281(-)
MRYAPLLHRSLTMSLNLMPRRSAARALDIALSVAVAFNLEADMIDEFSTDTLAVDTTNVLPTIDYASNTVVDSSLVEDNALQCSTTNSTVQLRGTRRM